MVEIFPSKYSAYKYNMSRWSRLDGQMVGRMVCLLSCVCSEFMGERRPRVPNTHQLNPAAGSRMKRHGLRRNRGIGTRGRRTEGGLDGCGARYRSR